ncbi:GGDEF domain-containing protein [Carbonactinospora thermoautotrophica]|uniref:GGDEF domain-containing protein n=1 Tax=Carbonactinospora thermoautotrophica TaxID=1469144 RepID=UPI00226F91B0|nr:GGDEF domain-containing protein [Carbonactinospora thermoautotrophica]
MSLLEIGLTGIALVLGAILASTTLAYRRLRESTYRELEELRHEITSLERSRDELERLSVTDPLTGVWNYRYLQMALEREVERATRFGRPLSILMLDLDGFSEINRRFGHQRGGAVLREFAQRVELETRQVDTLARYGGEEFVLILPETPADGAANVAERICYAVRKHPFGGSGEEPLHLTVSIGAAVYPFDGDHAATLLRTADQALYAAKQAGRDRWCLAGREPVGPTTPPFGLAVPHGGPARGDRPERASSAPEVAPGA